MHAATIARPLLVTLLALCPATRGDLVPPGATLIRWGEPGLPAGISDYRAISGWYEGLGVRGDGRLAAWVLPLDPLSPAAAVTNAVDVARGAWGWLARLADGRVLAAGQYATPLDDRYHVSLPEDLTNVVAIAAGTSHALVLTADGQVYAGGEQMAGECEVPLSATNVVQIAAGQWTSLALRADGTPIEWGHPSSLRLPAGQGLDQVAQVALGSSETYTLLRDGRLLIWGQDAAPARVWPVSSEVVEVAAAGSQCFVRLADGSVRTVRGMAVPEWVRNAVRLYGPWEPSGGVWVRGPLLTGVDGEWLHGRRLVAVGTNVRVQAHLAVPPSGPIRWLRDGQTLPGQSDAVLRLDHLQASDSGVYAVAVLTPEGELVSPSIEWVVGLPVLVGEPADLDIESEAAARVAVAAEAAEALSYAWRVDQEPIDTWNLRTQAFLPAQLPGNRPWIDLWPASVAMSGDYDVVVSTPYGSVTSRVARVRVRLAPTPDAQQTEQGGWAALRDETRRWELAQTFTPSISGRLERLEVVAGQVLGVDEFPTVFTIVEAVESAPGVTAPGTHVLGQAVVPHLGYPLAVPFGDAGVYLEAGTAYALLIHTDALRGSGSSYVFATSGGDTYPGGKLWSREPAKAWEPDPWNRDLVFATHMFSGIPSLRLAAPREGAWLDLHQPVALEAMPGPDFPGAAPVRFLVNETVMGEVWNRPFRFAWTPTALGEARLQAVADRPDGSPVSTAVVRVRVSPPRPVNDDFAARRTLVGENPTDAFDLAGSTRESPEPAVAEGALGHTVWWTWTAPRTAELVVGFFPPSSNLLAGIFYGHTPGTVGRLTGGAGGAALRVEQGTTYQIAVDARVADGASATLVLALNDVEITAPRSDAVATAPAQIAISATRRAFRRSLESIELKLDGVTSARWPAEPFQTVLTVLTPGRHALWTESTDAFGLTTRSAPVPFVVRPENDRFANALEVQGSHLRVTTSNRAATTERAGGPFGTGEPHYGDNQGGHSLWYRWTAPADGLCVLRGEGLPRGVLLGVYVGSDPARLTEISANAFAPGGDPTVFRASAGTSYWVMVDGLDGEEGEITWTLDLRPDHDLFAWRRLWTGTRQEEWLTLEGATLDPREELVAPPGSDASWWWSWRPPQSGHAVFRVATEGPAVVLGVFQGRKLAWLRPVIVSGAPAARAEVAFLAEAGETYELAVFGAELSGGQARVELALETVRLISPHSGATLPAHRAVVLEARFDVREEVVREMQLYANQQRLGAVAAAPFSLVWLDPAPGSYLLTAVARTESERDFASLPVRVLVYEGEDLPPARLFSSPSYGGTFLRDATGVLHLFGAPVPAFGHTNVPLPGWPQVGHFPPGVTQWLEVAATGPGPALSEVPDLGQGGVAVAPQIWALSQDGELFADGVTSVEFPAGVSRFTRLQGGWGFTVAVGDDGHVYVSGRNRLNLPGNHRWREASLAGSFLATLSERGRVFCHVRDIWAQPVTFEIPVASGAQQWTCLRVGGNSLLLEDDRGELYFFALGMAFDEPAPALVPRPPGVGRWRDAALGRDHVVALGDDGQLYAWGSNDTGELGSGDGLGFYPPLRRVKNPPGVTAWTGVAAGAGHSMAMANDCALYAWGANQDGQLGLAPFLPFFEPTRVALAEGVCGEMVVFSRTPAVLLPDGRFKLAFHTVLNRTYAVQYSDDLVLWKTVSPPVTGTGKVAEWSDGGPPQTDSPPGLTGQRLYRVVFHP
jgi:hypothetical protein